MNKYIKQLVEYYFHNEKELYENNYRKFRENFNWSYERRLLYQYNNDVDFDNIVNEEYHISDVFDDVIDVIGNIYKDNIDISNDIKVYTGYNFNIKDSLCKKLDNENIKYPIYVYILNDTESTSYSYIKSEDKNNNEIVIYLNSYMI